MSILKRAGVILLAVPLAARQSRGAGAAANHLSLSPGANATLTLASALPERYDDDGNRVFHGSMDNGR